MGSEILDVMDESGLVLSEITRRIGIRYGINATDGQVWEFLVLMREAGLVEEVAVGFGRTAWTKKELECLSPAGSA